eukprot:UN06999
MVESRKMLFYKLSTVNHITTAFQNLPGTGFNFTMFLTKAFLSRRRARIHDFGRDLPSRVRSHSSRNSQPEQHFVC